MAVAPLLAGWWQKQGYQIPAPASGGAGSLGTLNDGNAVMVEFLIEGVWTNFATLGFVLYRDSVDLQYGQSGEGRQSDAGSCSFTLRNTGSNPFSAGNPVSPYWEKVDQGTKVRISVPSGMDKSFRFQGEIADLEEASDLSGNDVYVSVRVAGILDRLGRSDAPLKSAWRRMIEAPDPAGTRTQPIAYWPMEDGTEADACAPVFGNELMNFTGTPSLAALSTFSTSDAIPNMSGSLFAGYVPNYTIDTTKPNASSVWWLMDAESTLTIGTMLVRVVTLTHRWEIVYVAADAVRLRILDYEGTIIYDSGSVAVDITNKRRFFVLGMTDDVSQTTAWLQSEAVGTDVYEGLISAFVSINGSPIQYVQLNPLAVETTFYIGHVAVFRHQQDAVNAASPYTFSPYSLNAYEGERADTRFSRLCTEGGVPHEVINPLTEGALAGTKVGVGQRMGPQHIKSLLNHLRDCAEADGGILYERRNDFGLGYRTLSTITSQTAALTLSHGDNELSEPLKPKRGTTGVRNSVTVTRDNGASFTVTDTTSRRGVTAIGKFEDSKSLDLYQDSQALNRAGWETHLGTVAEPRHESLSVQLASNEVKANTGLRQEILAVRPGDRVDVTDTPARISYDDITQLAIGYKERIDQFLHEISWNTVPEKPYRVAVLGTDGYDRMDSEDSRLADDISTTSTQLKVYSYDYNRWIDTTNYASKFPFDVKIGGERMTVTAINQIGEDTFTRSETSQWGTSESLDGFAWILIGGVATDYNVTSNIARIQNSTVNVSRKGVLQIAAPDTDQYVDVAFSATATGAAGYGMLIGRSDAESDMYAARLAFETSNALTLSIFKRVASTQTELATKTLRYTYSGGQFFRLRLKITGSLIQAKCWPQSSSSEPVAWDLTATDTSLDKSRDVGLRSVLAVGNTNVNPVTSFDNYQCIAGQYFTVTRSVNGVIKTHPNGTQVNIWDVVYLGL